MKPSIGRQSGNRKLAGPIKQRVQLCVDDHGAKLSQLPIASLTVVAQFQT